ncbi:MAG: hypothetical protein KDK39_19035 [Leptospiraceae bacterium]|nr:hypothetical protein [Leptospiraceae bacterium]
MIRFLSMESARNKLRVLWDFFFVLLALLNVALIAFDLTYFYLRPWLLQSSELHTVMELYDPIKGIHPDPLSKSYADQATEILKSAGAKTEFRTNPIPVRKILFIQDRIFRRQVWQDSGLNQNLVLLGQELQEFNALHPHAADFDHVDDILRASWDAGDRLEYELRRFWSGDLNQDHAVFFNQFILPLLQRAYVRERGLDGNYLDYFIYLDLPFLILFWIEFLLRWFLAIRRRELLRWWLFPLYNWYDVLGLMPMTELRFFRLLRIFSIYMRLYRSDITNVGDDIISRTVKSYSAIITEEISDRVAVRILTEMQDEIQSGASIDIFLTAIEPRREAIQDLATRYVRKAVAAQPGIPETRRMLARSLDRAARQVPSLTVVPDFLKTRLTREIGLAVFDGIQETLSESIQGEAGRQWIAEMVDFAIDDMMTEGRDSPLDQLYRAISQDVIENMKKAVSVKKWAR